MVPERMNKLFANFLVKAGYPRASLDAHPKADGADAPSYLITDLESGSTLAVFDLYTHLEPGDYDRVGHKLHRYLQQRGDDAIKAYCVVMDVSRPPGEQVLLARLDDKGQLVTLALKDLPPYHMLRSNYRSAKIESMSPPPSRVATSRFQQPLYVFVAIGLVIALVLDFILEFVLEVRFFTLGRTLVVLTVLGLLVVPQVRKWRR